MKTISLILLGTLFLFGCDKKSDKGSMSVGAYYVALKQECHDKGGLWTEGYTTAAGQTYSCDFN